MSKIRELERLLREGKISRRKFLALTSALGLTALVSPTLLSSRAMASTPKRGGRLRIALPDGNVSDTLDPGLQANMHLFVLNTGQIRNRLVEIDHKMQAIPELAESWESSPDAKQWIFQLRKGVEFHNGKTMDADDVIYSINFHRGEDSKSGGKPLLKGITDIKKEGKYTVVFSLEGGNADFPHLLTSYTLCILPKGDNGLSGMGTGGYILKSFEPGVNAFTVRNPNYFKENRAWFDEVESLVIADEVARLNAIKTGGLDVMKGVDYKTFDLLKNTPGIQAIQQNGFGHITFPMLTDTPPYDNNDVRLALKYAIDREQQVKIVLRGYGIVGNDHSIHPAQRYHASELPQREYDPDKAQYHIKKAGLQNATFQLHACTAPFPGAVDSAVLYKESASKAGINIEVVKVPVDGYWTDVWIKKPWCISLWHGRPVEDLMLTIAYASGGAWNETRFNHPRFDELLVAARSELDEKKRRQMYVEMQEILHYEGGAVIPFFRADLAVATDKIEHGPLAVNHPLDGFMCTERWWFV